MSILLLTQACTGELCFVRLSRPTVGALWRKHRLHPLRLGVAEEEGKQAEAPAPRHLLGVVQDGAGEDHGAAGDGPVARQVPQPMDDQVNYGSVSGTSSCKNNELSECR